MVLWVDEENNVSGYDQYGTSEHSSAVYNTGRSRAILHGNAKTVAAYYVRCVDKLDRRTRNAVLREVGSKGGLVRPNGPVDECEEETTRA